jgi:hypothetical protein
LRAEAATALERLAVAIEELFAERPGGQFDSGEWLGVPTLDLELVVPWDFTSEDPDAPYGRPRLDGRPGQDSAFRWVRGAALPDSARGVESAAVSVAIVELAEERIARLERRWKTLSAVTHGVAEILEADGGDTEELGDLPHVRNSAGMRFWIPPELKAFLDERLPAEESDPDRLAAVDAIVSGYFLGLGYSAPLLPVRVGEALGDLISRDFPEDGALPEPMLWTPDAHGKSAAAIVRFSPLVISPAALMASFRVEASAVVFEEDGDVRRSPTRAEVPAVVDGLRKLASRYRPGAEPVLVVKPSPPPAAAPRERAPPVPRLKPTTTLLDVRSRMDPETVRLNTFAVSGTLPRSWKRARPWGEVVSEEIEELLRTRGDAAFEKTGRKAGPLVMRNGRPALSILAEADLKCSLSARGGFIREDKDGSWLVRALRVGAGLVEVGVSWYGSAERVVSEKRDARVEELKRKLEADGQRRLSFADCSPEERALIAAELEHYGTLDDARALLDAVLRRAFAVGATMVDIPASELRLLLQCDEPGGRGNERIRRGLAALEDLRFMVQHRALKGIPNGSWRGRFVASWSYFEGGAGAHSDGIFVVELSRLVPGVAGLLKEAESGKRRLAEGKAAEALEGNPTVTEGALELIAGEKPRLRQRRKRGERPAKALSTVSPYRKRALCRSILEERAFDFLEANLTTSLVADVLGRPKKERKRGATADGFRTYGPDWCPLLPAGEWVGALGTHRRNPEAGWRLSGKAAPATGTGGQRPAGLIDILGRPYPSGGAARERREAELNTLRDFSAVLARVGGVLVGVSGTGGRSRRPASWSWISLEEARELPAKELPRVRWFPFLPADWPRRADAIFEAEQAERVARGEAERMVRVSLSPDEYLAAAEATGTKWQHRPGDLEPLETWADDGRPPAPPEARPLGERLEERLAETGLRKADLARAFGVAPQSVSRWVRPLDEREKSKGSGVPAALAELVERWVAGGELPTAEELETVSARNGRPRR